VTNKSKRLLHFSFIRRVTREELQSGGKGITELLADGCGLFVEIDG
jgi:hypothetical protein